MFFDNFLNLSVLLVFFAHSDDTLDDFAEPLKVHAATERFVADRFKQFDNRRTDVYSNTKRYDLL